MKLKKIIKILSILLITGVVFGYSFMEAEGIISGPQVIIHSPNNGTTVTKPLITIAGVTNNSIRITLNGREIFVDEDGNFTEQILLYPGNNRITTIVYDKFEKQKEETIEIVYKE